MSQAQLPAGGEVCALLLTAAWQIPRARELPQRALVIQGLKARDQGILSEFPSELTGRPLLIPSRSLPCCAESPLCVVSFIWCIYLVADIV